MTPEGVEPVAIGGASLLRSVTEADGFVIVPAESEGYPAGADVEVFLYSPFLGDNEANSETTSS
jgi:molybdopterin molybdotransferase